MINQDSNIQKTKFLPSNAASNGALAGSQSQMLRDIKESLSHLRREKPAQLSTSSGLTNLCPQASYQSTTSTYLLSSSKCHPMQIKSDFASAGTVQQNSGLGAVNNTNGVISSAYSGTSDARVTNSVKSAHYRQKALAEIRNSLEPFANKLELSSSSSNASDSSGFSQTIDSVSSCPNGLDKDKLHSNDDIGLLSSMGYNKDLALQVLNLSLNKNEDNAVKQESGQKLNRHKKTDLPNGLTRYVALSKINLKHLQKCNASTQPDSGWEGSQSQFGTGSATDSVRSDSPAGRNFEGSCDRAPWKRRQPVAFPVDDSPPPPPPPRAVGPPVDAPLPSPVSVSQTELRSQYGDGLSSTCHVRQLLKRKSPVPRTVARARPPGYASSNSTPQRGTSPVSFGRSVHHQQLFQKLQNLTTYSGGTSQNELPPPYPASSSHSPASLSSVYSSPPPSTSSGRRSPTPTVSSGEYSAPPFLQLQKRTPPPAYPSSSSSSSGSTHGSHPSSICSIVGAATATMVTTVGLIPHFSYLQSWSSRQAKSQSPVIMQSVKSTHVQKPVLQTAVAPTSPVCTTPQTFPVNNQQTIGNSSVLESSRTVHAEADHLNTYLSVQNPVNPPSYFSVQNVSRRHLTVNAQTSDQVQFVTVANGVSSNLPLYPLRSAGTNSAPPPPYSVTVKNQSIKQEGTSGPKQKQSQVVSRQDVLPGTQISLSVPTTDPPSYACGVAALAVQRATSGIGNNVPNYVSVQVTTSPSLQSNVQAPSVLGSVSSHLVNTVESICASQLTTPPRTYNSGISSNQIENNSYFLSQPPSPPPLPKKPAPILSDGLNSVSKSATRPESPYNANQLPVSSNSPINQVESGRDLRTPPPPPPYKKTMHQSPIPPRKVLTKEMEDERRETKIRNFSPTAFKFFMEQHIENLLKSHQQRIHRRQQLETEMAKVGLSEEAQNQMRLMLHQKESNYIRLKRAKMKKSMFVKIKTIGIGAFGEVALVRKVDTKQLYAMKTLRKADVLKRNQAAHVKAERDILAEADNEWVVKLYYSFQDKDNLYFVMDYIPGGDLMSLLIKFGIFEESLARFYITELVVAIESVHKMGFIHRDIKPDNILIDADGHIKLTDFGLCTGFRWTHNSKYYQKNGEHNRQDSMEPDENWNNECHCKPMKPLERRRRKEHQRCLAHSLVGTPNYIAPEVLMRTGYTQHCDWWSVGVILYEMLVGQPPFFANTPAETQLKVINWQTTLHIPKAASLSKEATDIILKLCCGPEERLGINGAEEIRAHPFFKTVNFDSDLRKQLAPYKPVISFPTDTSNFDPIDPDKLRSSDSSDEDKNDDDFGNTTHPDHAFFEFTFRRFFDDGGQAYPVKIPVEETTNHSSSICIESGSSPIYTDDSDFVYGDHNSSSYTDSKKPPVYV